MNKYSNDSNMPLNKKHLEKAIQNLKKINKKVRPAITTIPLWLDKKLKREKLDIVEYFIGLLKQKKVR